MIPNGIKNDPVLQHEKVAETRAVTGFQPSPEKDADRAASSKGRAVDDPPGRRTVWTAGARPVDGLRPPTARTRTRPHFAHRSACEASVSAGLRSAPNNNKKMFIKINEIRG